MKAIIEYNFADDDDIGLLRSHNLRSLYNKISSRYHLSASSRDCSWLGDFYLDTRYPGDNFVEVSEEDAVECLQITEKIKNDAYQMIEEEKQNRKNMLSSTRESELPYAARNCQDPPYNDIENNDNMTILQYEDDDL